MVYRKVRKMNLWIKKDKNKNLLGGVKVTYAPRGIAENPYVVTRTKRGKIISVQYLKTKKQALKRVKEMIRK